MGPPSVSVVMAAKNYARFLPEAVESVLASCGRDDVLLYLRVLVSQDEVTWAALVPVIDSLEA